MTGQIEVVSVYSVQPELELSFVCNLGVIILGLVVLLEDNCEI